MAHLIRRLVEAQLGWAEPFGSRLQPLVDRLFRRATAVRDLLNGTWLGHPLHPALTDLPVGAFVVVLILDLANQRTAADVALVVGLLGMVGAALTGLADYGDTYARPRSIATVHASLMVVGLVAYLVSLGLRLQGPADRTLPVAIAILGLIVVLAGAYVGGDLVFGLGNVVDRHAWDEPDGGWLPLDVSDLAEGVPSRAQAGADRLVVVRWGSVVHALHDTCSHAGGPLSEGKLDGRCIVCPWHGSRFNMADGSVQGGPAVFDQPRFEVRQTARGAYEARRVV